MPNLLNSWPEWLKSHEIPLRFHNASMKTPLEHQWEVYQSLWKIVTTEKDPLVFVRGNIGSGKTYAAIALAKHYHQQRVFPVYSNLAFLTSELITIRQGGSLLKFGDLKKRFKDADVLILDDFGLHRQDDFLLELFYEVIDVRANGNRSTVIFTNLTDRGLKETFTTPLLSRLAFFQLLTLPSVDLRKRDCVVNI